MNESMLDSSQLFFFSFCDGSAAFANSLCAARTYGQIPSAESGKGEGIEPCSVYTRRQSAEKMKSTAMANEELLSNMPTSEKRKSKGKEINEPSSCPPATKIQKIGYASNFTFYSFFVPCFIDNYQNGK